MFLLPGSCLQECQQTGRGTAGKIPQAMVSSARVMEMLRNLAVMMGFPQLTCFKCAPCLIESGSVHTDRGRARRSPRFKSLRKKMQFVRCLKWSLCMAICVIGTTGLAQRPNQRPAQRGTWQKEYKPLEFEGMPFRVMAPIQTETGKNIR